MSKIKGYSGIALIFVALALLFVWTDGLTTGLVVRTVPDYEAFKPYMTDQAFEILSTSTMFEKKQYIILVHDYDNDIQKVRELLSEYDIQELEFISGIAVNARRDQLIKLLENINVEIVYENTPVELLRQNAQNVIGINTLKQFGFTLDGNGIKIGIIDSGVNHNHHEFSCENGIGNGTCPIKKSVSTTPHASLYIGTHGTNVAGIIHATAPKSHLYSYKAFDGESGSSLAVLAAIDEAINDNVDIISLSIGARRGSDGQAPCQNTLFERAIKKAVDNNITVISATGNNPEHKVYIPACFPETIAIGAITNNKNPAEYSTHGPEVDFVMPGTFTNLTIGSEEGTSYATPLATAVFALTKEFYKKRYEYDLLPNQLREIGKKYARDLHDIGKDEKTGYGLLKITEIILGLSNKAIILPEKSSIDLNEIKLQENITIHSNKLDSIEISWTNLTLENEEKEVQMIIKQNEERISKNDNITLDNELHSRGTITVEIDENQSLPSGIYSGEIILKNDAAQTSIPVTYTHTGPGIDLSEIKVGLFSFTKHTSSMMLGFMHSFIDIIEEYTQDEEELEYFKEELKTIMSTMNYDDLLAFIEGDNYEINNNFNTYDAIITYVKIPKTNTITNMSVKFSTLDREIELFEFDKINESELQELNITQEEIENYDIYYLYPYEMYESQIIYEPLELYKIADNATDFIAQIRVENNETWYTVKTVEGKIKDNLSINLGKGIFFLGEENKLNITVQDNQGIPLNKIWNIIENMPFKYPPEQLTAIINNNILTLQKDTDDLFGARFFTPTTSQFSEGIQELTIMYSIGQSTGTENFQVMLTNPVNMQVTHPNNPVAINSPATYTLQFSKHGSQSVNINGNLKLNDACKDYLEISETTFNKTSINVNNPQDIQFTITQTKPNIYQYDCRIYTEYTVTNLYPEHSSLNSYNNTEEPIHFELQGIQISPKVTLNTSTPTVQMGGNGQITLVIEADEKADFAGFYQINVTHSTTQRTEGYNFKQITAGEKETIHKTIPVQGQGTHTVTARVWNDLGVDIKKQTKFSVVDNLLEYTISTDKSRPHIDEIVRISMNIKNNNNKSETVQVTMDNSQGITIIEGFPELNLNPGEQKTTSARVRISDTNNVRVGGNIATAPPTQFSKPWEYTFTTQDGRFIWINVTSTYRTYSADFDDILTFIVDNNCEETNTACTRTCRDEKRTCDIECRDLFDVHRNEYNVCREDCNRYDDSRDRLSCRDNCRSDYEFAQRDNEDCRERCTQDLEDCDKVCEDDLQICTDEAIPARIKIDPFYDREFDRVDFIAEGRFDNEFSLREGETRKLDFLDDGYYETELLLHRLKEDPAVEDERRDCQDVRTTERNVCNDIHNDCISGCDDALCRDICREERSICQEDAEFNYEFCIDDIIVLFSSYELRIRSIDPEPIIIRNITIGNETNVTIPGNETNQTTNETNQTQPIPPDPTPEPTCTFDTLSECKDEFECRNARGYWYDNACHTNQRPTEQEDPIDQGGQPGDQTPHEPSIEQPTPPSRSSSSRGGTFMFIIIIILLGGAGAGAFMYIRAKKQSDTSYQQETQQESRKNTPEVREKLKDYFVKQIVKGNSMNHIVSSLKNLGWDAEIIEEVTNELVNDPVRREATQIMQFAKAYNTYDPNTLRQRFTQANPQALNHAIEELRNMRGQ